ncbi:hypothetical protein LH128_17987 [Sphingomonas sp. LH128]|nr:hypothetical protein LH128_17987 [Sphingomonas sp. LH128]
MMTARTVREFLLLHNQRLYDFLCQGLADRSLGSQDLAQLSAIHLANRREIARWDRDLSCGTATSCA